MFGGLKDHPDLFIFREEITCLVLKGSKEIFIICVCDLLVSLSVMYLGHFLVPERQQTVKYTKGPNVMRRVLFKSLLGLVIGCDHFLVQ